MLTKILFKQVSILPLALFRIVFGFVLVLQFIKFRELFLVDFIHRNYFLKYDFFEWVQLPSENLLNLIFIILIASAILFMLGIAFKIAAIIQFMGMSYCFLIEKSIYNNHYYLFILLSFLMIFTNADGAISLKRNKITSIAAWQLLLIKLQIFVLYFWGGLAKLNYDWLVNAQPVKMWLPDMMGSFYSELPPSFIDTIAYFITYSGLLIDLTVGFLLFSPKWKWIAFVVSIIFHGSNFFLFDIGYFPLFGILSLVVFLEQLFPKKISPPDTGLFAATSKRKVVAVLFSIWFIIQVIIPFRHLLLPGKVQWQMNGYLFSWYMKLNDYAPLLRFEVVLPGNSQPFTFEMDKLSESPMQRHYIATYPFITVKFAHDIETYLKKENNISGDIKVYCDSYLSLNGRALQRKINPTVDLTQIELKPLQKYFTKYNWMVALGDYSYVDKTVVYRLKRMEESIQ